MYHCKIARTEKEFTAVARLNYETFVEEIPQHEPNEARLLVDKFHHENTYIVLYKDDELIGMLAFRDQRPFSIDGKIGEVEQFLAPELCTKMCEVRLLAIKKEYRVGRVFLRLAQALYAYVLGKGYSACVISGVTSQEHLYKHIGFWQFAEAVGTKDATFLPMVLTNEDGQAFYEQFQKKHAIFYPGPVEQNIPLKYTTVSHRSEMFVQLQSKLRGKLLQMSDMPDVAIVNGSGTLANEMMLSQIKARFANKRGLICTNGEFGQRLIKQATALGLNFDVYEVSWGLPFEKKQLEQYVQTASWCVLVHGETSAGMLNDLQPFKQLKQQYGFTLGVDCISSFGAVPFSMKGVDLATATSGKAIGALAGLSFVFFEGEVMSGGALYEDLALYVNNVPFTLPSYLIGNVLEHLESYPIRYELLQNRLQNVLQMDKLSFLKSNHYTTAVTFEASASLILDAQLNGIELHAQSEYLRKRELAQISTIQPSFEKDFKTFKNWLTVYKTIQ